MDIKEDGKEKRGCIMSCSTMAVLFVAYVVLILTMGESAAFIVLDVLFIYIIIAVAYYIRKIRSDGETRKEASQRWGCTIAVCGFLIAAVVFSGLDMQGVECKKCEDVYEWIVVGFALFGLFGIIRRILKF